MKQFCSANVINCVWVELHFNENILSPFLKLLSDSPAILLMILGPLMRKKNAPVSLATALAMSAFPVPGGP